MRTVSPAKPYQDPVPSYKDYLRLYLEQAPISLAIIRAAECRLLQQFEMRQPVLDIGCGDGLFATICFSAKFQFGLDLNPHEVARCQRRGAYEKVIGCDARKIPMDTESVLTVFSNGAFEHIPELPDALKEIFRVLKPGGTLIFTLPNHLFGRGLFFFRLLDRLGLRPAASFYRNAFNRLFRHHYLLSDKEWRELLQSAGFQNSDFLVYHSKRMSAVHELSLVTALPTIITKRLFGRLILFRSIRRRLAPILARMLRSICEEEGGEYSYVVVTHKPG